MVFSIKKRRSRILVYGLVTLLVLGVLAGCSSSPSVDEAAEAASEEGTPSFERISYEDAFTYAKSAEEQIIETNSGVKLNQYGESAAEALIYSDEYAGLFCAYWSALEEVGESGESRFGKSKLRWEVDYTNIDFRDRLVDAYKTSGPEAFRDLYATIYQEEVFPAVSSKWQENL